MVSLIGDLTKTIVVDLGFAGMKELRDNAKACPAAIQADVAVQGWIRPSLSDVLRSDLPERGQPPSAPQTVGMFHP